MNTMPFTIQILNEFKILLTEKKGNLAMDKSSKSVFQIYYHLSPREPRLP